MDKPSLFDIFHYRSEVMLELSGLRLGVIGAYCLAFLFLPVARGSALLRLVDIPFEQAARYHVWLGHLTMLLFTLHGLCYVIAWTMQGRLLRDVSLQPSFKCCYTHCTLYMLYRVSGSSSIFKPSLHMVAIKVALGRTEQYSSFLLTFIAADNFLEWFWCCHSSRSCESVGRSTDVDHISSSSQEAAVRVVLLHTPAIHRVCGILCIAYR